MVQKNGNAGRYGSVHAIFGGNRLTVIVPNMWTVGRQRGRPLHFSGLLGMYAKSIK